MCIPFVVDTANEYSSVRVFEYDCILKRQHICRLLLRLCWSVELKYVCVCVRESHCYYCFWFLYPCSWLFVRAQYHFMLIFVLVVVVFVFACCFRLFCVLFTFDSLLSMCCVYSIRNHCASIHKTHWTQLFPDSLVRFLPLYFSLY